MRGGTSNDFFPDAPSFSRTLLAETQFSPSLSPPPLSHVLARESRDSSADFRGFRADSSSVDSRARHADEIKEIKKKK